MKKQKKQKEGNLTISQAWKKYLEETGTILDGLPKTVNAKKLEAISGKQPRLMAKFDTPEERPEIFRDANYSLVAIKNGEYLIFEGSTFYTIPNCSNSKSYTPRLDFPLETLGRGTGESQYIDIAHITGLFSEFTDTRNLYLTIRGRERTKRFDFRIDSSKLEISVDGVQIEVDAGYEGKNEIILIEGKTKDLSSFNVRQLYYPFRHFSQLVPGKKVRTIFFAYSLKKATYSLYEFGFRNKEVLDSIYPIKCCIYSLIKPRTYSIEALFDKDFETENNIVPQADAISNIIELLSLINKGQNSVSEIADNFSFDKRQSNYYGEAAQFLGLITRSYGVFELTERGKRFIATDPRDQQLFIAKLVINSWFFRELISRAKKKGYFTKQDVENLIANVTSIEGSQRYSKSTIGRRTSTIMAWIHWLSEELRPFTVENDKVILK